MDKFTIFLATPPGLEQLLLAETTELGFDAPTVLDGGVEFQGTWSDVWRANLCLRGASRVLARIGEFRAMHLAQLDKRSRKFPWIDVLRADVPVRVEATCRASKIYHAKAASQRVERALSETLGIKIAQDAPVTLKVRIDDDLCTFSLDTTGDALHKRGHKEAVGKAPMRENLAALFLRDCGFSGSEPVVDPMCGSGTFLIEAAEIAKGLFPGRSRSFAFEHLATFDPAVWADLKARQNIKSVDVKFYGSDRDAGAIRNSKANATRANVDDLTIFTCHAVSDLQRPEGPTGLVIVNPPYGARIGDRKLLFSVYGALGKTLLERFKGWRIGIITSDAGLAKATGLPFKGQANTISHGGLKIALHKTGPL